MTYTAFASDHPVAADVANLVPEYARTNGNALRDAVLGGMFKDYAYAQSGSSAEEPTYQTWRSANGSGSIILRATNSWSNGYCTQTLWELSVNSGSTYDAIYTEGRTFDGSGNLTATNNGGSIVSWFQQWVGKFKALRTAYNAHSTAVVTAAPHGVGTIASQSAGAVAITGGAINGTTIGASSQASAEFLRATERFYHFGFTPGAAVNIDWSYGGSYVNNTGACTLSNINVPPSGVSAPSTGRMPTHTVFVANFNSITWPGETRWGVAGKPSIAGQALVQLMTHDGGANVVAIVAWRNA